MPRRDISRRAPGRRRETVRASGHLSEPSACALRSHRRPPGTEAARRLDRFRCAPDAAVIRRRPSPEVWSALELRRACSRCHRLPRGSHRPSPERGPTAGDRRGVLLDARAARLPGRRSCRRRRGDRRVLGRCRGAPALTVCRTVGSSRHRHGRRRANASRARSPPGARRPASSARPRQAGRDASVHDRRSGPGPHVSAGSD